MFQNFKEVFFKLQRLLLQILHLLILQKILYTEQKLVKFQQICIK